MMRFRRSGLEFTRAKPRAAWVLLWLMALVGCAPGAGVEPVAGTQRVELGGEAFELELAVTAAEQFQGLSDRAVIAEDGGMLFVFAEPRVRVFVMRRCPVPIDVAFLDRGGRVLRTHAMKVEPADTSEDDLRRYSSVYPAQYAIEVAGGTLKRVGLKVGDVVELPGEELKAMHESADGDGVAQR